MKYYISGDGSGKTFGIHKTNDDDTPPFFNSVIVKSGIKTMKEAQQEIRRLEKEQRE